MDSKNLLTKALSFIKRRCDGFVGRFWATYYSARYSHNGNKFECHARLHNCRVSIQGSGHIITLSGGNIRNIRLELSGYGHKLSIGKNLTVNEGGRIVMEDNGCRLEIGDNAYIVSCFFAIRDNGTSITIGDDCMFSAQTTVRTSDARSILADGKRINPGKNVVIGDHVWVGYGANILKGSTIESHSIIGTQSVVAGLHVPQGTVAAGNPARIVKTGVDWDSRRLM